MKTEETTSPFTLPAVGSIIIYQKKTDGVESVRVTVFCASTEKQLYEKFSRVELFLMLCMRKHSLS